MSDCDGERSWVLMALGVLIAAVGGLMTWLAAHVRDDTAAHERIAKLEQKVEDNEVP